MDESAFGQTHKADLEVSEAASAGALNSNKVQAGTLPTVCSDQVLLVRDQLAENAGRLWIPDVCLGGRPSERKRLSIGGVGTLSRRLIAVERARALGRRSPGFQAWAVERDARSGWRHRLQGRTNAQIDPRRH